MELDLIENYFRVPTHDNRRMDETTGTCVVNVIKIGDSIFDNGIKFEDIKNMIGSVHLDVYHNDLMTLPGNDNFINIYTKLHEIFSMPIKPETKSSDFEIVLLIEGYYGINYLVTGMLPTGLNDGQGAALTFRAHSIANNIGVDNLAIKLNQQREEALSKKEPKDAIIFYYGQTSIRNSTASRMEELEAEIKRANLEGKVSVNKFFTKVSGKVSAIKKEMQERLDDKRDPTAKYAYDCKLQTERRSVAYNLDGLEEAKNDILTKVDNAKVIIIHIPGYKSHAWASVATYALFHKDKKTVYFTGNIEKIRYAGSLISTSDYLQAGTVGDVFTRLVYDKKGEVGSNIVTKILNKEI